MQTEMMTQDMAATPHNLIASDRVEGTPVRRRNGDRIGTIQRLMIDKSTGQVAYAVLRFGGFLGVGDKHLPISWERLHYDMALGGYELELTSEETAHIQSHEADPAFDWGDRRREMEQQFVRTPHYWGM